jgi:anti-anti-sigma factor
MATEPFSITAVSAGPGIMVAGIEGEIDLFCSPLLEASLTSVARGCEHLVVDLTRLGFFDLAAFRTVVSVLRTCEPGQRRAVVMSAYGSRILDLAGLGDHELVERSLEDALVSVASRDRIA